MNKNEKKVSETSTKETLDTIPKQALDKEIHDLMGPLFEKHEVSNAIVVAMTPDNNVALYYRGHFYDVTRLLGDVYKKFKAQIDEELGN